MRFQRAPDGTIYFILHYLNHSGGETTLKTWIRIIKKFRRSRKLSIQEESKELYHTKYNRQVEKSLRTYRRSLSTWTIVLRSYKSLAKSFSESYKMRQLFERYLPSGY